MLTKTRKVGKLLVCDIHLRRETTVYYKLDLDGIAIELRFDRGTFIDTGGKKFSLDLDVIPGVWVEFEPNGYYRRVKA